MIAPGPPAPAAARHGGGGCRGLAAPGRAAAAGRAHGLHDPVRGGRAGRPGPQPYAWAELHAAEHPLWPGVREVPLYDPPPTAAAFRLISQLPLRVALAWKLLSVGCLAVIGLLLADLLGVRRWTPRLTIVALLTLFGPVRGSLTLGQIEAAVLLPLVAAIWLCLRRPQTRQVTALSAGLAVLALGKPQLAYLPVAVVLVHGDRRDRQAAIVGATAAALALVLLAGGPRPAPAGATG